MHYADHGVSLDMDRVVMSNTAKKWIQLGGVMLACLLVACVGHSAYSPEDRTSGLKGIDADHNGIRDDIDALIAQKYSDTPQMKRVADNYARAIQAFMEATTKVGAYAAAQTMNHAIACITKVLSGDANYVKSNQLFKDIEALTANTHERYKKYWNSNSMAGGATFPYDPAHLVCD